MKILLSLIVLPILFFSEYTLSKGAVGKFYIGMSPDEVYAIAGKENVSLIDQNLEALYSPALVFYASDNKPLLFEIDCNFIWRITVFSTKYKTDLGVGVGNRYGELKKKYKIKHIIQGEGNIVAYVENLNMSFCLDPTMIKTNDPTIETIHDDVKIVKIYVLREITK